MPAEGVFSLIWLLIALPLAVPCAAASAAAAPTRGGTCWAPHGASASFVLGRRAAAGDAAGPTRSAPSGRPSSPGSTPGRSGDMAFQLDQLSMVFVLLITTSAR
jgi:hypothetical protein